MSRAGAARGRRRPEPPATYGAMPVSTRTAPENA